MKKKSKIEEKKLQTPSASKNAAVPASVHLLAWLRAGSFRCTVATSCLNLAAVA
jgi:hypothetical protein